MDLDFWDCFENKTNKKQDLSQGQDSSPDSALRQVKLFANPDAAANANADSGGSTIALPGLCPGELKIIQVFAVCKYAKPLFVRCGSFSLFPYATCVAWA